MSSTVGSRLREVRTLAGLTGRELGRLSGRPETQCALIEAREQRVVRPVILDAFASVLGCSVSWLACGEGEPPTKEAIAAAVARARAQRDYDATRPSHPPTPTPTSKAA